MRSFARNDAARAIVRAGWVASIAALSVSFVVVAFVFVIGARRCRQHIRHGDRA